MLVSIIIICFNQDKFVSEAITSAISQTYPNLEIIVVDDGSTDESQEVISKMASKHNIQTILNSKNIGNCRSFNKALAISNGSYLIDLAADDLLLSNRVSIGINALLSLSENYGVHFSDAEIIDEKGYYIKTHYSRNSENDINEEIPEGWIFKELVSRYFICTPTMMFKREVIQHLGGYDEALTYEDFDFWVRSSKIFKYTCSKEVLVKKRVIKNSLSAKQRNFRNMHLASTLEVCKKAFNLCETGEEFDALKNRLLYELKWALWTANLKVAAGIIHVYLRCLSH